MRIIISILIAVAALTGWFARDELSILLDKIPLLANLENAEQAQPEANREVPELFEPQEEAAIPEPLAEPKVKPREIVSSPLRQTEPVASPESEASPVPQPPALTDDPEPPPLREQAPSAAPTLLTVSGIVSETNQARSDEGLTRLFLNEKLNAAARAKAEDMLARQYFEHVSPTGERPADIVAKAGYEFILVGENLALGNFGDDRKLVRAWLDSPGHRANILHVSYTEIGVAVLQGVFEGRNTWLAVQEFGRPLDLCPRVDPGLRDRVDIFQAEVNRIRAILESERAELETEEAKQKADYNQRVAEYNKLVGQHNALLEELKVMVSDYNQQVNAFNACTSQ